MTDKRKTSDESMSSPPRKRRRRHSTEEVQEVKGARPPITAFEVAMLLRFDTPFRRQTLAYIQQAIALHDYIVFIQENTALLTYQQQQLLERQLQDDVEYKADIKRAELSRATVAAQQREYALPPSDKIESLLVKIEGLKQQLITLVGQQVALHQRWEKEHHKQAAKIVDSWIASEDKSGMIHLPGGGQVAATDENKETLIAAMVPVPIGKQCIYNPDLGAHIKSQHQCDLKNPPKEGNRMVDLAAAKGAAFAMIAAAGAMNRLDGSKSCSLPARAKAVDKQGLQTKLALPNDKADIANDLALSIAIDGVNNSLNVANEEIKSIQSLQRAAALASGITPRNQPPSA